MEIDFDKIITPAILADYLTADYGQRLAVWKNGKVSIVEHSAEWQSNDNVPIAEVRCPGIGYVDTDYFTEGFVERGFTNIDDWTIRYIEIGTGRYVGTIEDVIRERCKSGNVSSELDILIIRLEADFKKNN